MATEEAQVDYTLSNPDTLTKLKSAGEISQKVGIPWCHNDAEQAARYDSSLALEGIVEDCACGRLDLSRVFNAAGQVVARTCKTAFIASTLTAGGRYSKPLRNSASQVRMSWISVRRETKS